MHIVVAIKQVPETSNVKMDPEKGTIIRSGSEAVVNPLDLYAIEAALQMKEQYGGRVTVISMGPPRAEKALREAVAMGCDGAWLISDRKFGGSDTWATSYILSRALTAIGEFDLIITGERATDGDTAQVGPGIAAWLDLPLATYVAKIGALETPPTGPVRLEADRLVEDGYQQIRTTLPALLTVVKEIAEPRLPTLEGKKRARALEIPLLDRDALELDPVNIGLKGSPTKVVKIDTPRVTRGGRTVRADENPEGAVRELLEFLREKELIQEESV